MGGGLDNETTRRRDDVASCVLELGGVMELIVTRMRCARPFVMES